ncbi:MAG TPA: metalloregulator ArsR/SmtB family transcription factor [Chitinophagaceae bacterium]|nr:metalloregulator ArsR/SmtB family transcription factor [Chitinophagaceae bacterium]
MAVIIHAIHHKLRQDIIKLIDKNPNIIVSDIYKKLRVEQSTCSQHLAILRRAGVLRTKRLGKNVMYDVNFNRVNEINQFVKLILNSSKDSDIIE